MTLSKTYLIAKPVWFALCAKNTRTMRTQVGSSRPQQQDHLDSGRSEGKDESGVSMK
jgi:hypothetical protein